MPAFSSLRRGWQRAQEIAERRLPALTRWRRPEPLPIVLNRRRIYVVPTRFGLVFALMLFVMLLGALNYNNNAALLLTCVLAAASFLSLFTAFRALDGVELGAVHAVSCFAGEALELNLNFVPTRRVRRALRLKLGDAERIFDLTPSDDGHLVLPTPTTQRGRWRLPRLRLGCDFPYGWFWAWSWLHPPLEVIIYPQPEANGPSLPDTHPDLNARPQRRHGDEYATLRDYRVSDPPRLIAWKASARHDKLLVREYEQPVSGEVALEWDALPGLDIEARIARLTRWVCEAEVRQRRYSLQLPQGKLGPGLGPAHRHACLSALALL